MTEYSPEHQELPPTYLLGCVKGKLQRPARARDLYISEWFKAARGFVEKNIAETGGSWYILSAQFGLLHPEQIIKPYELSLNTMAADDRKFWAKLVAADIKKQIPPGKLIFLAGRNYRQYLIPLLDDYECLAPLARDGIGKQLKKLKNFRIYD